MPVEEIIDPSRAICDCHHHLWDAGPSDRYTYLDLKLDRGRGHRVVSTVYVECGSQYRNWGPNHLRPVGETEFVDSVDSEHIIKAIVGYADLRESRVDEVLDNHLEAGRGRFRGIRQVLAYDSDPTIGGRRADPPQNLMEQAAFKKGLGFVARRGLTFDAWVYHHQLGQLASVVEEFPDLHVVINHLGGPLTWAEYGRDPEVTGIWRIGLSRLAGLPNTSLKLGGIGMPLLRRVISHASELSTSERLATSWGEDILWCIEQFGAERSMFESNFPVDRVNYDYVTLWNAFKRVVTHASASEKDLLFHDTAATIYRFIP